MSIVGSLYCERCKLPQITCICEYRPVLESGITFCLLTHETEFHKPTNTGRLIEECLPNTCVYKWHRTEPDQNLLNYIANPNYQHWLVFPTDAAEHLHRVTRFDSEEAKVIGTGKTHSFILLDATWQQAAKMFRRSPYLNDLPIISMAPERGSQYTLRRKSQDHHLCTVEIASELLNIAGEYENSSILNDYFQVFSQHYLAAKSNHAVKHKSKEMSRLTALRLEKSSDTKTGEQE